MYWPWRLSLAPLLLIAPGCASLDVRQDVERSAASVQQAVGISSELLLLDEQAADTKTAELLAGGVTSDEAVQIALLNNPRVRAAMLSIGVSRADFVQSTLFTNPLLTLSLRLPDGGGLANFETTLTQNIAELWLMPARRKVAERNLDRRVLEAARTAASIALDTRTAYIRTLRADQQQAVARDALGVAERLVEFAQLRQKAGSGGEIDANLAQTQRLDAATAFRNAELGATESRCELGRLLGLSIPPASLALSGELGEPIAWTNGPEPLQRAAREYRLDLRIADQTVAEADARVHEERARFLKAVELGFALEREERRAGDGSQGEDVILGPTFGIELPLWDQNQAQIARAQRLLQQAIQLRDALLIDVAQDIHSRLARARTAVENAHFYRDQQLQTAERNATLSREAYRTGNVAFLSLLEAERNRLSARVGYLAALEAAALATVELERTTGRPAAVLRALDTSTQPAATQPAAAEKEP